MRGGGGEEDYSSHECDTAITERITVIVNLTGHLACNEKEGDEEDYGSHECVTVIADDYGNWDLVVQCLLVYPNVRSSYQHPALLDFTLQLLCAGWCAQKFI